MKYHRPGKLRPSERPFAMRRFAILIVVLGVGGDVVTHNYAFIVGGVVGVLIGVLAAFLQRRRSPRTTSSADVG
jgi:hypothetical protein